MYSGGRGSVDGRERRWMFRRRRVQGCKTGVLSRRDARRQKRAEKGRKRPGPRRYKTSWMVVARNQRRAVCRAQGERAHQHRRGCVASELTAAASLARESRRRAGQSWGLASTTRIFAFQWPPPPSIAEWPWVRRRQRASFAGRSGPAATRNARFQRPFAGSALLRLGLLSPRYAVWRTFADQE